MTQSRTAALADGVSDVIALHAATGRRYPDPSPTDLRRMDAEMRDALAAPLTAGPAGLRAESVRVPGRDGQLDGQLYLPHHRRHSTTLVFSHGGGWVCGSWRTVDQLCARLADAVGMAVVNVDYALAPESPFPQALQDVAATADWAVENSSRWGGDGTIAIGGESAGANLAAAVSLLRRDAGDRSLRAQLLLYPALSPTLDTSSARDNATGYELTTAAVRYFWSEYLQGADVDARAAPLHAEGHHGLPPAVIAAAEFDPLRDDAIRYAQLLTQANVSVSLHVFPGLVHGFARWTHRVRAADTALDEVARALTTMLSGGRP